jgi:hypothetical protein
MKSDSRNYIRDRLLTFFTNTIWISLKPLFAITDCTMSGHPAFSIDSTSSGEAGVLTFFMNTCKMIWAFRIGGAFWFYGWKKDTIMHFDLAKKIGYWYFMQNLVGLLVH